MVPTYVNRWTWRLLVALWLLLLAVFSAFRVAFFVRYHDQFAAAGAGDLAAAFLTGLRIDVATLAALTGLPAVALLLASPWRWRRAVAWLYAAFLGALTAAVVVVHTIDLLYYERVGRRLAFETVRMLHEWRPIVTLIADAYALPAVAGLATLGLLLALGAAIVWRLTRRRWRPVPGWSNALQAIALLLLVVVAARGGLQSKPIGVGAAFRGSDLALGHLALNPVFTAGLAIPWGGRREFHYYPEAKALAITRNLLDLHGRPDPHYPLLRDATSADEGTATGPACPRNLVIIVLESFSARFTGVLGGSKGVTPNFDRLAGEGVLFTDFYAAGHRSIEGVAAILTGYAAIPNAPLIGSPLGQQAMQSLPLILRAHDYHSFFLHGAFRGSMWFDQFARRNGFDRYIAEDDFADAGTKSDGVWGIFDEYTLQRLHEELEAARKPVFAFYFSLSSHTPFVLPPAYVGRFAPETPDAAMLNGIAYTDDALGRFFDRARQSDYWEHTTFVITADHTMGALARNLRERMWIPLLIVSPGDPRVPPGTRVHTLGGQATLAPTALDLLAISAPNAFAAYSMLHPVTRPFALLNIGNPYGWITDGSLLLHDLTKPLALYDYRNDPNLQANLLAVATSDSGEEPDAHRAVQDFQGYLQTMNNLVMENRVFPIRPQPPAPTSLRACSDHQPAGGLAQDNTRR